ncbi:MAG: esterase-like activity of phytase family protein [bacterium]|nr:esterase-like activity of phytase family protein [bacterium]
MKTPILISYRILLLSISLLSVSLHAEQVRELKLIKKYILDTKPYPQRMDLSGLTSDGKHLYTVSDLSDQNDIFRIQLDPKPALVKIMQLDSSWLTSWHAKNFESGRYDTEGIAYCNGKFYLAEESTRNILEVKAVGDFYRPTVVKPDWISFHSKKYSMNPFSGVKNAGLEAIACHPDKDSVFIFNERQFRMGYVLGLTKSELRSQFTFPSGSEYPSKKGKSWVFPDFAGAHFHAGKLYTLIRNRQQVVEIHPYNFKVLRRWSYGDTAKKIFKQSNVFGLAEGLAIHEGYFFIVLDHNLWQHKESDIRNPVVLKFAVREGKL